MANVNLNIQNLVKEKSADLVKKYMEVLDWQVKENANMSYSLQGMRNYISNEVTKDYWLQEVYPENIAKAHQEGDFHVHDMGELNAYCCGWDLQDLLRIGFNGVAGKIACKPAKHFNSALGQVVNFIYTLQGETAGAQAFSNFDTLLAPFVRKDNLSYETVKQALQSFVYNVNVPTRVGFQTPFFNITMDVNPPSYLARENVLIGGEVMSEKYGDFQEEMDMINQAFAEVMLEGDANGRIFTFPLPTYNITKDFDWNDSRYDKIWEMTAKYGIPTFSNYINSDMNPEDARSMCCRLRLDNRELRKRGGGLFGSNPLTGSIGVVTINLPRLGYNSSSRPELMANLASLMDLARDSLEIKRELIEELTEKGLYPYSKYYLQNIKMKNGTYWANHFSTIGLIGMNELLLNFIEKDIATAEGQKLSAEILDFMRERISKYQEDTSHLYNLEATPAEGTSYRLAKIDQKKNPEIVFANDRHVKVSQAEPYYTNSSQLPVGYTEDIFEALELQDNLQTKYTGGTVLHGFLGERVDDIESIKVLVKRIAENYHLPYFTLTPTFSICPEHGYIHGEQHTCQKCGKECEVYSRVVGYIRPIEQWNKGKQAEFHDRLEFKV
jgi:ribonucleoside-triphosphate reductase (formate)